MLPVYETVRYTNPRALPPVLGVLPSHWFVLTLL